VKTIVDCVTANGVCGARANNTGPEPPKIELFPTTLVVTVSAATVALAVTSFLIYHKKTKVKV